MAREVARDEMVVSFLNLPTYISDDEIMAKLAVWGVRATSPIKSGQELTFFMASGSAESNLMNQFSLCRTLQNLKLWRGQSTSG